MDVVTVPFLGDVPVPIAVAAIALTGAIVGAALAWLTARAARQHDARIRLTDQKLAAYTAVLKAIDDQLLFQFAYIGADDFVPPDNFDPTLIQRAVIDSQLVVSPLARTFSMGVFINAHILALILKATDAERDEEWKRTLRLAVGALWESRVSMLDLARRDLYVPGWPEWAADPAEKGSSDTLKAWLSADDNPSPQHRSRVARLGDGLLRRRKPAGRPRRGSHDS
jgi:hypothetical protein